LIGEVCQSFGRAHRRVGLYFKGFGAPTAFAGNRYGIDPTC
jgi:hypothetical protein